MAKARGHRANKANDSFGTVNNENLYRGKYREEVYKEDEEEQVEAQEADPADQQEAATQQEETGDSFVEAKEDASENHDYKRYDDLKRHYDEKVGEFKEEIESLRKTMADRAAEMRGVTPPKTQEELEEFKERYPDVFDVVQTVSSMQTESQVAKLREELGTIKEREKELEKQKAYEELLRPSQISRNLNQKKSSLHG